VEETLAITRDLIRRSRATLDALERARRKEDEAAPGDDRGSTDPPAPRR
jgi:hypothetical protein